MKESSRQNKIFKKRERNRRSDRYCLKKKKEKRKKLEMNKIKIGS